MAIQIQRTWEANKMPITLRQLKKGALSLSLVFSLVSIGIHTITLADDNTNNQDILFYQLPSGQKLYVKPIHTQPIVTIDTWLNVGSVDETPDVNGVSHFLEHLIFKGTKDYANGALDTLFTEKGASFNAATSKDYTHFHITVATRYFQDILPAHADMLMNAEVPSEQLEPERKVVQEEINRALDDPNRKAINLVFQALFGSHPYSMETLGPKSNIATIKREAILNYFHKWYQPKNMVTVVVGDIDPETVKQQVQQAFETAYNKVPNRPVAEPPRTFPIPPLKSGPQFFQFSDPNVSQPSLMLVFPGPKIAQSDDAVALDIATLILGQGASSRMNQQMRNNKGLARDVGAGNYTMQQAGMVYYQADTTEKNIIPTEKELLAELADFYNNGPTQIEVDKAKKQMVKTFAFLNESTEGYAETLGTNAALGKLSDFTDYLDRVNKLTPQSVQQTFQRYTNLKQSIVALILPGALDGKTTANIAKQSETTFSTVCKQVSALCTNNTLGETKPTTQPLVGEKNTPEITAFKLPNGVQVILKPVPEVQTTAIQMMFRGGRLTEPKVGVGDLVAKMMYKGTDKLSAGELAAYFENNGLDFNASFQKDYFSISGTSLSTDFDSLLSILKTVLNTAPFPASELSLEKDYMIQDIQTRRDAPQARMFELGTQTVYPNHPYGITGEQVAKNIPTITRNDLVAYFNSLKNNAQDLTISVVGHFDIPKVSEQLKQLVGEFQSNNEPKGLPKTLPLLTAKTITDHKPKQAATWIEYTWQGPEISDTQNYAALKVLTEILGGSFTSRLFMDLRKTKGYAYETASYYAGSIENGPFVAYIGTDPKNESVVLSGLDEEIQKLKDKPVSPEELSRAKSQIIGNFLLAHESMADIALYLALYQTLGTGYMFDKKYPDIIQAVTIDDVQHIAKKLFSTPGVKIIVDPVSIRQENE